MAVYTPVSREQVIDFLEDYDLGTLESFEGIAQGVSNTNYHLFTDRGRFILTLFEPHRVELSHLDFFLSYAAHLDASDVPGARAVENKKGRLYDELADRPAAIMTFCEGEHPAEVTPQLCSKLGALAAYMHLAGKSFGRELRNEFGPDRWKKWSKALGENLNDICFGLTDSVRGELGELAERWPAGLPRGAIHADLFPDNVFFKEDRISGVIDFHFACTDFLAYDLAIIINAWCFNSQAAFIPERYQALMKGYEDVRALSAEEKAALPVLARGAAMRFLLSRCEELLAYKEGDLTKPHDPGAFIKRLEFLQNEAGRSGITGKEDNV